TAAQIARDAPLAALLATWQDARVKQALIARLNAHRCEHAAFYAAAGYLPLAVSGAAAAHVIAFQRRLGAARLLAIAARWPLSLARAALAEPCVPPVAWQDTAVALSDGAALRDVLHDDTAAFGDSAIRLDVALRDFPVALYFAAD